MTGNEHFRNSQYQISKIRISDDEKTKLAWQKLAVAILSQLCVDCRKPRTHEEVGTIIETSYFENICQLAKIPSDKIKTICLNGGIQKKIRV